MDGRFDAMRAFPLRVGLFLKETSSYLTESLFHDFMAALRADVRRPQAGALRIQAYSSRILSAAGIEVVVEGREHLSCLDAGGMIVSNHTSFWDVLLIANVHATHFITSVEVKQTPLIGYLAAAGGSFFVDRRNRAKLSDEIPQIARALRQGLTIGLFPEGTTSDGTSILPFKRSLFRSLKTCSVPIVPLAISFQTREGQPLPLHEAERIFYYGEHVLTRQLLRTFLGQGVRAVMRFAEPLLPEQFPQEAIHEDRLHTYLCDETRRRMLALHQPVVRE